MQTRPHPDVGPQRLPRFVRAILASRLRGSTRLTLALARRIATLQATPLQVPELGTLHLDLRLLSAHGLLVNPLPEEPERQVMRRLVRTGQVAHDIGAHLGLHTLLLSRLVGLRGHVDAIEPNPAVWPALSRTIAALPNTSLHAFAVSDTARRSELFVPADPSMASLVDWVRRRSSTHTEPCEERRLDDMIEAGVLRRPDFVKCDVEGAELLVFRGARNTLDSTEAPVIVFESNDRSTRAFGFEHGAALRYLASLKSPNYQFYTIGSDGELAQIGGVDRPHANIVALPFSKRSFLGV